MMVCQIDKETAVNTFANTGLTKQQDVFLLFWSYTIGKEAPFTCVSSKFGFLWKLKYTMPVKSF